MCGPRWVDRFQECEMKSRLRTPSSVGGDLEFKVCFTKKKELIQLNLSFQCLRNKDYVQFFGCTSFRLD